MKKIVVSIFTISLFTLNVFSQGKQDKMTVNILGRTTHFGSYNKDVTSLSQLPLIIKDSANDLIKIYLGNLSLETRFDGGLVNDLNHYDADSNKINRSIPKYQLEFTLKYPSIGIKNFAIELRLDENGKPLKITWPRKDYTDASKFLSRDIIKAFALKQAAKLDFNKRNYEVDFRYDEGKQKFLWLFLFPIANENKNIKDYDSIEINWADVNDFEVSKISKVTVY